MAAKLAVLIALAATIAHSSTAEAYPVHRRFFQVAYQFPARCSLCHEGEAGSERNSYGKDWAARGEDIQAFRKIERRDSDADGHDNLAEIAAHSNPGDPRSTPEDPGRQYTASQEIPIPTEPLSLVMESVEGVEAAEVTLTPAQATHIEQMAKATLDVHDRYPTLYFGVEGGERTLVALFIQLTPVPGQPFHLIISADRQGRLHKSALFRAGDEQGSDYIPFLACLVGHTKSNLPAPGESGCPRIEGKGKVQEALLIAIRAALWTISEVARAPSPGNDAAVLPPSGDAGAPAASDDIDLSGPKTSASTPMRSGSLMTLAVLASAGSLLALVALTVRLALRRGRGAVTKIRLAELSPSLRLVAGIAFLSFVLVQAVAAVDVYVQTRVVHDSALEYFQYLSWARLLGTTHAHIFGYAIMYGAIGFLVAMTSASERLKCTVIAAAMWSGIFDVASWWGMKHLSERFEWLALLTGALTGAATLTALVLIARSLLEKPKAVSS